MTLKDQNPRLNRKIKPGVPVFIFSLAIDTILLNLLQSSCKSNSNYYYEAMKPEQRKRLEALVEILVTPERFGKIALAGTVEAEYPDLPQAALFYFPDRPGDSAA